MEKTTITRLKVNYQVSLGEKLVGVFTTMQKAKAAAKVAETVGKTLGWEKPASISEVLADKAA